MAEHVADERAQVFGSRRGAVHPRAQVWRLRIFRRRLFLVRVPDEVKPDFVDGRAPAWG
jgi:hypothetical protein